VADEHNHGEHNPLDGHRHGPKLLCVTVAPRDVGYVKERRPTGVARVHDRKNCLDEAVQVNDRNDPAIEFQQIFAGIPPPMRNPSWKVHSPTGLHGDLPIFDDGPKCAGSHVSLFVLLEMHMKRRPTGVWWQRAFEHQDDFSPVCRFSIFRGWFIASISFHSEYVD